MPVACDSQMDQILCREKQRSLLNNLFGKPHQLPPPALFVYGHTSTGKTLVVNSLLETNKLPHVLVNCVECYNQRFLYEHILNSIDGELDTVTETSELIRCENMNDFIRLLKAVVLEKQLKGETLYLVLDKAERLRDMDANILPAFLRLQELTSLNVCTVLVSEIVWEKFRFGTGFCEPFVIHFPDYSKDEMIEIICADCPEEYPQGFYNMYVNLVLSIFHYACRNLTELKHMKISSECQTVWIKVRRPVTRRLIWIQIVFNSNHKFARSVQKIVCLNFPKYVQPIQAGEATVSDTKKLWKNIEPHLKKALQTLYLREVSSSQWERYQQELQEADSASLQGLSHRSHVELPYYSKYLLIAAYLASYNPAKSDRKFFAKHSGKTKKKPHQAAKKQERASNHMLGPKPFPLDRLMAIFYSVVEGRVAPTANIFMQISSLVSLHLMGHVSGEDQIEQPKYKCLVSLEFIKSVARTVNFDVARYLFDFV